MKRTVLAKKNSKSKSSSTRVPQGRHLSITSPKLAYVVCVNDGGYSDLELFKVYRVKSDPEARKAGLLRIIDASGEDYLYPQNFFQPIHASPRLFKIAKQAAE